MSAPVQVGPSPSGGGPVPSDPRPPVAEAPTLSSIQRRVLEGRANGMSYLEIAEEQKYNYQSVKNAGFRVITKFGAKDMAHAVYLAVQLRVLDAARRHGDHAGFAAHRYRNEEPCEACWEGERAYRRERRAARKASKVDAA